MKKINKYIYTILGIGFFYKILKIILKKIIELEKGKVIAEFTKDIALKTSKEILRLIKSREEIDEKIHNKYNADNNSL